LEAPEKDKVTVGLAVGIILSGLGQLLQGISSVLRGGLFQQGREREREREEVSQRNLCGELSVERDRNFSQRNLRREIAGRIADGNFSQGNLRGEIAGRIAGVMCLPKESSR